MAELSVEGKVAFGRGDAGAIVPDGTSFADRRGWSPGERRPGRGAGAWIADVDAGAQHRAVAPV
ncbi:hypothetical protein [Amnibacterium sp.]|uniref:hypothetical protein n=1 Tax=Amnibacterium sp. TaxID=1872496 RepID=UPI002610E91F|nr:hypothetical protein [Amnibacterium sp.]